MSVFYSFVLPVISCVYVCVSVYSINQTNLGKSYISKVIRVSVRQKHKQMHSEGTTVIMSVCTYSKQHVPQRNALATTNKLVHS